MSKKLVGLAITVFVLLLVFGLTACKESPDGEQEDDVVGKFYTLQEAYDQELLTVSDLQSIANYHANGTHPADVLSIDVKNAIKEIAARNMREKELDPVEEAKAEGFFINKYYGTYNGSVAFMIRNQYILYPAVELDINETIEGVLFHYNSPYKIVVWKQ